MLSLEKTFANFDWRPIRSDNDVVVDTVRVAKISTNKPSPSGHANGSGEHYPVLPSTLNPSASAATGR